MYKSGTSSTSGEWYFDVYLASGAADNAARIFGPGFLSDEADMTFSPVGASVNFGCGAVASGSFNVDEWHTIGIKWAALNFQCNVDGGSWGSQHAFLYPGGGSLSIFYVHSPSANFYIDNISDVPAGPSVVAGYYPIIAPTSPARNETSVVDLSNIAETGTVTIPTANTNFYNELVISYRKVNDLIPTGISTIDFPAAITAGQSYAYSATLNIPVDTPGNNYFLVTYTLNGNQFSGSYADNPIISDTVFQGFINGDDTWVTDHSGGGSPPGGILNPAAWPAGIAPDDCAGLSGIDAAICNLKNFITGALYPSQGAINQFTATIGLFSQKWPMNYISTFVKTLGDIRAGVDEGAPLTISIFGVGGPIDTTAFNLPVVPGQALTLGQAIKTFLVFLVCMIFLAWAISYMHRIPQAG
jgi:hypothetical protein